MAKRKRADPASGSAPLSAPVAAPGAPTVAKRDLSALSFDDMVNTRVLSSDGAPAASKKRPAPAASRPPSVKHASSSASSHAMRAEPGSSGSASSKAKRQPSAADSEAEEEEGAPSIAGHRGELEALKARDPKFYAYLQKNSAALLDFGGEGDDEEEEEDEGSDGEEDENQLGDEGEGEEEEEEATRRAADGSREVTLITPALARKVFDAAFSSSAGTGYSYTALGKALSMFRAAVYVGDAPDVLARLGLNSASQTAGGKKTGAGGKTGKDARGEDRVHAAERDAKRAPVLLRYKISSPSVFMLVVTQVLQRAAPALAAHLGSRAGGSKAAETGGPGPRVPLASYSGWPKVGLPSRALVKCALHLLAQANDPSLQLFILRSLRPYIPYLQTQGQLTRKAAGAFIRLWAEEAATEEVKMEAFLRARQVATALPSPALELVLKGMYHAYARAAKTVNEGTQPGLLLMASCLTEVYGLEEGASYTHAFVYIRDLAVHLRTALTSKSKESMGKVLSWQFLNCLRVWTGVIASHGADPTRQLFQLAYPLTQVIIGAIKLQPSPRYIPFALHAVGFLIELCWSTGTYIPTAPLLWDILRSPALSKKPAAQSAPGAAGPAPLSLQVRSGSAVVSSRAFQDAVVGRVLDLLLDGAKSCWASPALPEIAAPIIVQLRQFAKETRSPAWRSRSKALIDALSGQAALVSSRRAALAAAPADKAAVAGFMAAEAAKYQADRAAAKAAAAARAMEEARAAAAAAAEREKEEAAASRGKKKGRSGREQDKRGGAGEEDEEEDSSSDDEDVELDSEAEPAEDEDEDSEEEEVQERRPRVHTKKPRLAAPAPAVPRAAPSSSGAKAPGGRAAKPLSLKIKGKLPSDTVQDFDASDLLGDEE